MGQQPGLSFAYKRVEGNLRTPCTISRNGALLNPQPRMSDGGRLCCTVRADKEVQIPGAASTQTMMRWVITFRHWPAAQLPIQALDHITAQGYVYGVDTENAPQTDGVSTKVYAYALFTVSPTGTLGPPLYLRPNATVNVTRAGVAVPNTSPTSVEIMPAAPMNIDFQGVQYTTDIKAPPGSPNALTSWQVNDVMTLIGAPAYQIQSYTVLSAIPPLPLDLLPVWTIRVKGYLR